METLGAIDIGSNAIRLVIGELDHHGDIKTLKKLREPVRLGKDVFATGDISPRTREKALAAFVKFRETLEEYGVRHYRAVATAALREAKDRDSFVQDVRAKTGIHIEVIDGIEEGRLIYSAVAHRMDLEDRVVLLIDIGGGSVEFTIVDHGTVRATQSFKLGTVRMLQLMEDRGLKEKQLAGVIQEHFAPAKAFLSENLKGLHVDFAIGTGGNFESLGKLRVALLHKTSIFSISRSELEKLSEHLQSMTIRERIQFLRLRPDRADVVVPAALVTLMTLERASVDVLMIPYVGLRDGILADVAATKPIPAPR